LSAVNEGLPDFLSDDDDDDGVVDGAHGRADDGVPRPNCQVQ
jgi:hypothetical protein